MSPAAPEKSEKQHGECFSGLTFSENEITCQPQILNICVVFGHGLLEITTQLGGLWLATLRCQPNFQHQADY